MINTASMPNDLMTMEQVCEALQVSQSTVRLWIRTKRLPALRLGGQRLLRVRRKDVDALLVPAIAGEKDED